MDFLKLLEGKKKCACGRDHSCAVERVIIGEGAVKSVAECVEAYKNILLVADENTYAVIGEAVVNQLSGKLENKIVLKSEGYLVPNEDAVEKVQAVLTGNTDLIVGVGSGVIQDLCKYVSFNASLPYQIVATAPSMDGYASVGAAMIMGNMKVTYSAHVPQVIIGDVDVLKNAPIDMIKSGYGDILGKFSCLNDWKLSRLVNGEYFCDYVYDLTYEMLDKTKDLGEKLLARDAEAIKTLMEALVGVGVAMALVGNSRPASGSEHHLSHFFEVTGIMENRPYFLHGIDVAYSAVRTQKLREELLALDAPTVGEKLTENEYENKIKAIYGAAAEGVIALQKKLGSYKLDRSGVYADKWQEIKEILKEVPTSDKLSEYLASVKLDMSEFEKMYGKEKIQNAVWFAKDLKDRYSVLWMYFETRYAK